LKLGGEDGFMLGSLHRDITILTRSFHTIYADVTNYDDHTLAQPEDGVRGIGWIFQDEYKWTNTTGYEFNSYRYVGWIQFLFSNPIVPGYITFQAEIGHTWDDSSLSVSGLNLTATGPELSFSNNSASEKWRQTGPVLFYVQ
jgi:hypothetical protein